MNSDLEKMPQRLLGFDSSGEIFIENDRILRGIYKGKGSQVRKVLEILTKADLRQRNIVETSVIDSHPHMGLGYDLILEHSKIPFISYPHEWSASMFKDAALLHIDLYTHLSASGLTLKDWHPYNILFNNSSPIFVDFTSIIPLEDLHNEAYLNPPRVAPGFRKMWDANSCYLYEMYTRMYVPYFLLPLYLIKNSKKNNFRDKLLKNTMNSCGSKLTVSEVFSGASTSVRISYEIKNFFKKISLIESGNTKKRFFDLVRKELESLDIAKESSPYSDYYKAKKEDLDFNPSPEWTKKQNLVYDYLTRTKPSTLLDIGCNTGWFSILAEKLKYKVVSLDVDEACIDILYRKAKRENLAILPLRIDISSLTPDIPPAMFENEPSLSRIGGNPPLIIAAHDRLKCDCVLALAIIHHLALGKGIKLGVIVKNLSGLTRSTLILEFVEKTDKLIEEERHFFPSFNAEPTSFNWYNIDSLHNELSKEFRIVEVNQSHPESRFIIACRK